jgi:hypothetical protein
MSETSLSGREEREASSPKQPSSQRSLNQKPPQGMVNNSALIEAVRISSAASEDKAHRRTPSHSLSPLPSSPLLLDPLPTTQLLEGEAAQLAIWEYEKQKEDQRKVMELEAALGGSVQAKTAEAPARKSSVMSVLREGGASLTKAAGKKATSKAKGELHLRWKERRAVVDHRSALPASRRSLSGARRLPVSLDLRSSATALNLFSYTELSTNVPS